MQPSEKSIDLENFLGNMFGFDRRETIKSNKCAPFPNGCGKNVEEKDFANELEKKEFAISSLCPTCQREFFDNI